MRASIRSALVVPVVTFLAGVSFGGAIWPWQAATAQTASQVFELRTYTAAEGKLEQLHARFRDHTMSLFERHGITNVGYWTPQDEPLSANTLVYIIAHRDRAAAEKSWADFRADPDWQRARDASQVDGPLVEKVVSIFMDATDFSPMK